MPWLIEPPSLRKSSLQSIVSNYSYWYVDQPASQEDFISPFQDLDDDMIQELIRLGFQGSDIQYLFHHNLRHLNLGHVGGARTITDSCIRLLSNRCPKLTHLSLNDLSHVKPATLCELVSNLSQLISLQLAYTNTDSSVLQKIAENCPKLLDLNVHSCYKLNDENLLLLCNQTESPQTSPQLTRLKQSAELCVDTVVALLNSHRNLRSVGGCNLIYQALDRMYGKEYQLKKEFQKTWIHNLTEVTINVPEVGRLDLELTTLCCPHLTRLSSLKDLTIGGAYVISSITFSDVFQTDVLPILEKIGVNLTSLYFYNMGEVCVFRIGELCPNLQYLDLRVNFKSSTYTPISDLHFRQLRVLEISDALFENYAIHVPAQALSLILQNATEISQLTFNRVNNLTDNIVLKANKKHGFRFLTRASFFECSHITKDTGIILLSPDIPLQYLEFDRCQRLTIHDRYDLFKYAEHKRVTIYYDEYD